MTPISVKAVMVDAAGRVLFLRNPRGELELPGGRPECGESMEEALAREVAEECGCAIIESVYLASRSCAIVPGTTVLLVFFKCAYGGHIINVGDEHTESRWVEVTGARPDDVPEYYWFAALQSARQGRSGDDIQDPCLHLEYPLSTGERDRQRLSITADVYDAGTTAFLAPYLPSTHGRVLEVGSGHGSISRWVAESRPGALVVGVDSSARQVELATREAASLTIPNLRYLVADLREVETWTDVGQDFDLIICRFTLLHLTERDRIVKGLLDLLGTSGVLVIEEPALESLFCVPDVPAFTRANSAIRHYGQRNGLDYDCISDVWRLANVLACTVKDARFSQPTVWSSAHKALVLLSYMDFKPRLVAGSILDAVDADEIETSLGRDYMDERVISGGLRTIQIALSREAGAGI